MFVKTAAGLSLMLLLILLQSTNSTIIVTPLQQDLDFPKLDEYYMKIISPGDDILQMAQSCNIDIVTEPDYNVFVNLTSPPYYWNYSIQPGFHRMSYIGVNCRNVTPSTSGQYYDYWGRTLGFPLYPLNLSAFRTALEVIVSVQKDSWFTQMPLGYLYERLDHVVLPGNVFWYNPSVPYYPEEWAVAESILTGAGFAWDLGPDSMPHTTDDKWTCPDGTVLWDGTRPGPWRSDRKAGFISPGEYMYGILVIGPSPMVSPVFYEIIMRHAKKWNLFFCGVEDFKPPTTTGPNYLFMDDSRDIIIPGWPQLVIYWNRDHDLYFESIGLDRDPDYLYDFFHPDVDIPGGLNTAGLNNTCLNRVLEAIKFWKFKDWELLEANTGFGILIIPPSTTFGPYGPFDHIVPVSAIVERGDLVSGVYEQELVEGVDYTVIWEFSIPHGGWTVSIHIEIGIGLSPGSALELKFPIGTYKESITDIYKIRELVFLAQWKLYDLTPYLPICSRKHINLYKVIMEQGKWLEGWVESPGFGSQPIEHTIPWTFNYLHWNYQPTGGLLNYPIIGQVSTLNPIAASWSYEWTVLWRLYDGLFVINPYTHEYMPWVAYRWEIEPWTSYNVENGVAITFYLRNDVTWQDGDNLTAEDVAWNFEFIESITPPELEFIWKPLIRSEVLDEYIIKLYINGTAWSFEDFGSWALIFPQTAWQNYIGDYDPATTDDYYAAANYKPWETPHPQRPLTMLYGTGPYIFDYWDPLIGRGIIHLVKNDDYWVKINLQETQALGYDGLLWHIGIEENCNTYYNVQFTNVNPTQSITFTYWGAFKDVGKSGPRPGASITLNPYQSVTYTYGPAVPQATGDLGGGSPTPRFFEYDGASDSKDLSLMLRILKSGITGEYIPQKWTIYINNILFKQL